MINNVVLVGRLSKDPEYSKTSSGVSTVKFTVACGRQYTSNGTKQTDFIDCVAWRQAADFLGQYGKKGRLVGVDGSIQIRNYEAKDGHKVYVTEVICDKVQILDKSEQMEKPVVAMSKRAEAVKEQEDDPMSYAYGFGDMVIDSDDLPF